MKRTIQIEGPMLSVKFAPAGRLAHGHYSISTTGKSVEQIRSELDVLEFHHAAKAARLVESEPLLGTQIMVDGKPLTWTDIIIQPRGTDWEMYVSLSNADGSRAACMPLRIVRSAVADLPSNDELSGIVTAAIRKEWGEIAAEAVKIAQLQKMLGV